MVTNYGVNGDLAYNALQRVHQIIDNRPDVVTVHVGANDANASLSNKNLRIDDPDEAATYPPDDRVVPRQPCRNRPPAEPGEISADRAPLAPGHQGRPRLGTGTPVSPIQRDGRRSS
ncbi:hypothetical protein [Kribbella sp. VKM Ac-2568]|uniref:hypothetical protein n=1 Tax=Kribbella sp. VKM Ac-2568 TaxID=2512219 RepID=UPI00351A8EA6